MIDVRREMGKHHVHMILKHRSDYGWFFMQSENLDRSGHDFHAPPSHRESIIIRERKLINSYAVKSGLLRFNFMLDCCNPGSLPDAHLIAALLDLVSIQNHFVSLRAVYYCIVLYSSIYIVPGI